MEVRNSYRNKNSLVTKRRVATAVNFLLVCQVRGKSCRLQPLGANALTAFSPPVLLSSPIRVESTASFRDCRCSFLVGRVGSFKYVAFPGLGCALQERRMRFHEAVNEIQLHFHKVRKPRFGTFGSILDEKKEELSRPQSFAEYGNNETSFATSSSRKDVFTRLFVLVLILGLLLTLAMGMDDSSSSMTDIMPDVVLPFDATDAKVERMEADVATQGLKKAAINLLGTAVPERGTDVAAIAVGEGVAGMLGTVGMLMLRIIPAGLSVYITSLRSRLPTVREYNADERTQGQNEKLLPDESSSLNQNAPSGKLMDGMMEVMAGGDYFLTRAAAIPLFEEAGASETMTLLMSVLVAFVPYSWIKFNSRRREEMKRMRSLQSSLEIYSTQVAVSRGQEEEGKTLDKGSKKAPKEVDFVELFADVMKWLEYDVLMNDFSGKLLGPIPALSSSAAAGLESAAFGALSAFSTQLYSDLIYRYTDYGPEVATLESRTRKSKGWASLYFNKCLSSAALFGVYESVRAPISAAIMKFLSGGVDSCMGSTDFTVCMETFMVDNPPDPTAEAQIRALITAVVGLINRLGLDSSEDGFDLGYGVSEYVRALIVHLYSLMVNRFPLINEFDFQFSFF